MPALSHEERRSIAKVDQWIAGGGGQAPDWLPSKMRKQNTCSSMPSHISGQHRAVPGLGSAPGIFSPELEFAGSSEPQSVERGQLKRKRPDKIPVFAGSIDKPSRVPWENCKNSENTPSNTLSAWMTIPMESHEGLNDESPFNAHKVVTGVVDGFAALLQGADAAKLLAASAMCGPTRPDPDPDSTGQQRKPPMLANIGPLLSKRTSSVTACHSQAHLPQTDKRQLQSPATRA